MISKFELGPACLEISFVFLGELKLVLFLRYIVLVMNCEPSFDLICVYPTFFNGNFFMVHFIYRTATECRRLVGHSGPVFAVSINHDNMYLLSSSEDKTIRLWSLFTFTTLVCYKGHNFPVWDVQFW